MAHCWTVCQAAQRGKNILGCFHDFSPSKGSSEKIALFRALSAREGDRIEWCTFPTCSIYCRNAPRGLPKRVTRKEECSPGEGYAPWPHFMLGERRYEIKRSERQQSKEQWTKSLSSSLSGGTEFATRRLPTGQLGLIIKTIDEKQRNVVQAHWD